MLRASLHQTGQTMETDLKIHFLDDYIHHLLFQIGGFICSHHGTKASGVFRDSKVLTDLISSVMLNVSPSLQVRL